MTGLGYRQVKTKEKDVCRVNILVLKRLGCGREKSVRMGVGVCVWKGGGVYLREQNVQKVNHT